MDKSRLEAFSDGVIAVIITIMVLELKVPHGSSLADIAPLLPVFVTYVLSYVNVGIYWNNHHHMLHATDRIDGRVMWTNLFLLFWLSLIPFVTGWAGENRFTPLPTATYAFVLMMSALAYVTLQAAISRCNGPDSEIARAVGTDWKGKVSLASYILSIPLAFVAPAASALIMIAVAALWFVPDRRIERLGEAKHAAPPSEDESG